MSFCIYAHDCVEAVSALRDAGITVLADPEDQPWGERMARVADPDGNVVVIMQRLPAATPDVVAERVDVVAALLQHHRRQAERGRRRRRSGRSHRW